MKEMIISMFSKLFHQTTNNNVIFRSKKTIRRREQASFFIIGKILVVVVAAAAVVVVITIHDGQKNVIITSKNNNNNKLFQQLLPVVRVQGFLLDSGTSIHIRTNHRQRRIQQNLLVLSQYSKPIIRDNNNNRKQLLSLLSLQSSKSESSWLELESSIGFPKDHIFPSTIDSVFDPSTPTFSNDVPTLFRERHGWCPYSERVWLVLEYLIDQGKLDSYNTIKIDNTGTGARPSYFTGSTPQIRWPGTTRNMGESMDIIYELDERYNDGVLQSKDPVMKQLVAEFRNIFPQRSRPSSRAAFLFQNNGDPLWKSVFEETLQKTNQLLQQGGDGPFLGGSSTISIADIAWIPFLERYRYQLPCLHGSSLQPFNETKYPYLVQWYNAIEAVIPSYLCRVKGDGSSWRKVLSMAGYGNGGYIPEQINENMEQRKAVEVEEAKQSILAVQNDETKLWHQYASKRPYVATSPAKEAAATIIRNHQAIQRDAIKQQQKKTLSTNFPTSPDEMDSALRMLVIQLLNMDTNVEFSATSIPSSVQALAQFLDERMCVPRDMGSVSAAAIKVIANTATG